MSYLVPSMKGIGARPIIYPPNIGNRVFWWDATGDAGGTFSNSGATTPCADNDRVYVMQGASGQKLIQATAGNRPLFRLNQQNGLPGVYFDRTRHDGLADSTDNWSALKGSTGGLTVALIWKPNWSEQGVYLTMNAPGANGLGIFNTSTTNEISGRRRGNASGSDAHATMPTMFTPEAVCFVLTTNGPGSSKTLVVADNHSESGSATADSADAGSAWTQFLLGQGDPVLTTRGCTAWFFEVIMWDAYADATARTSIYNYANSKWALP
jgi:hypothetical protein